MQLLVIVASLCFILNKVFLLLGNSQIVSERTKWLMGVLGALLFIVYFFSIESPILSTLEIGLTVLTLYRFIVGINRNKTFEQMLGVFTGIIVFLLFLEKYQGYIETLQLAGALGMLIGTFYLIQEKYKTGFTLYALGHIFLTIFGYQKSETIFWILQLVQAVLCLTIFISEKLWKPLEEILRKKYLKKYLLSKWWKLNEDYLLFNHIFDYLGGKFMTKKPCECIEELGVIIDCYFELTVWHNKPCMGDAPHTPGLGTPIVMEGLKGDESLTIQIHKENSLSVNPDEKKICTLRIDPKEFTFSKQMGEYFLEFPFTFLVEKEKRKGRACLHFEHENVSWGKCSLFYLNVLNN